MSFRDDAVGMFWANLGRDKTPSAKIPRVLPETPETNWRPPRDFPNLANARRIAVDVETKDIDLREKGPGVRRGGHIVGLAVGTDEGARWYFPMRHEVEQEYNLSPDAVIAWAKDALAGSQPKVGANLLYDADYLAQEGVALGGEWQDVQIAEPLLDENQFRYNLESLGTRHLGEGKTTDEMVKWIYRAYGVKSTEAIGEVWRTSPRLVGPYAEGDVDLPLRILDKQLPLLSAQGLEELWAIESGLLPMLLAMRRGGVRIDLAKRQAVDDELEVAIKIAQQRLDAIGGFQVNTNAAAHLVRAFDKVGVSYPRTAPTKAHPQGNPSFAKGWMEHSAAPIAQLVVEIRRLTKLQQFVRGFLDHAIGDRIYTLFHPVKTDDNGTVSGRFASSDPNLQNIPIRDAIWGPRIRAIFVPEPGHEWVRHDWSQIEYRFLAHFARGTAGEEVRELYRSNPKTDFHIMVAELTGLDRKPAKNVNFGLVYGMGVPLLAATLGMTVEQAEEEVFAVYHERAPFVRDTYNFASQRATDRGFVKTILGRRARFEMWSPGRGGRDNDPDAPSALHETAARAKWGNGIRRAFTHKALNRVLQGSSADLMKKAMLLIWRAGIYRVLPVALLTVHDELDHSKPRTREADEATREVKRIMETAVKLKVPIIAQEERGPSWGECK